MTSSPPQTAPTCIVDNLSFVIGDMLLDTKFTFKKIANALIKACSVKRIHNCQFSVQNYCRNAKVSNLI